MVAKKILCVLFLLIVLTSCSACYGGIIYVKPGGTGPDGLSWSNAFGTIQAGITAAASQTEKTVWVAAGTYTENIALSSGIQLYGGFAGTESPSDPDVYANRDFITNETKIHPLASGAIATAASGTRIDGFTIENGSGTLGGAVYCTGTTCAIAYDKIQNNSAHLGGGIYATGTGLVVSESTFLNNAASDTALAPGIAQGGGIWIQNGSLIATHCSFEGQTATVTLGDGSAKGGGIYASGGTSVRLNRCIFDSCIVSGTVDTHIDWGGGIYASGVNTTVTNCFIYKCGARGGGDVEPAYGGGIAFQNQGTISIVNNTFYENEVSPNAGNLDDIDRPYGLGAAIYTNGGSNATIINNIISNSRGTAVVNNGMAVTFNYNVIWHNAGGDIFGFKFPNINDNNIMKDPQFRDVANNDYHILYGSPAKDAGTKTSGVPGYDIDGEIRTVPIDIGADEFVDTDNDGGADNDPLETTPTTIVPPEIDPDGDGIYYPYDNCPSVANPTQTDSNGDGVGDACTGSVLVYYVDGSVASSGDGTTWATAFKTIQEAINAADLHNMSGWTNNPEVWVKAGTYNENIMVWHGVRVYGGWAGTESPLTPDVHSSRNLSANLTTINGSTLNTTALIGHLPQDRYLTEPLKTYYDNIQTVVDGFTITNGKSELGGGVSVYKENANVSADRIQNSIASLGGGIYAYKSTCIIGDGIGPAPGNILTGDTTLSGNTATGVTTYAGYGGGAYVEGGSPMIYANIVRGNTAYFGGGIAARLSGVTILENEIGCQSSTNTAIGTSGDGLGGGIYLYKSDAILNLDTIVDNTASGASSEGGGIWADTSNFWLKNSIVAYNNAISGGAIYGTSSIPTITYTDFWSNSAPQFVGITDPTTTATNLAVDPIFTNRASCDYSLDEESPLISAGDPADGSPNLGAFQDEDPPVTIGEAINTENGIEVQISHAIVTAVFNDGFYIEQIDRSAGIKVLSDNAPVSVGMLVDVDGIVTQLNGEKMIINATITAVYSADKLRASALGSGQIIAPLGVSGKQFATKGLTCIGLLIKTWGKVVSISEDNSSFYISDGSKQNIKIIVPSESELPTNGSFVIVTGVACKDADKSGKTCSAVRIRDYGQDIFCPQE